MNLQWKSFNIHLKSFNEFLRDNVPKADGILAYEGYLEIVESLPFNQSDIDAVSNYYDSLTEQGESAKLSRPGRLRDAILGVKQELLTKDLSNLNTVERKILMNIPLTQQEEDDILGYS